MNEVYVLPININNKWKTFTYSSRLLTTNFEYQIDGL